MKAIEDQSSSVSTVNVERELDAVNALVESDSIAPVDPVVDGALGRLEFILILFCRFRFRFEFFELSGRFDEAPLSLLIRIS